MTRYTFLSPSCVREHVIVFVQPNALFTKLISACGFDQDGTGYHCSWCLVFPVTGQAVCLN